MSSPSRVFIHVNDKNTHCYCLCEERSGGSDVSPSSSFLPDTVTQFRSVIPRTCSFPKQLFGGKFTKIILPPRSVETGSAFGVCGQRAAVKSGRRRIRFFWDIKNIRQLEIHGCQRAAKTFVFSKAAAASTKNQNTADRTSKYIHSHWL